LTNFKIIGKEIRIMKKLLLIIPFLLFPSLVLAENINVSVNVTPALPPPPPPTPMQLTVGLVSILFALTPIYYTVKYFLFSPKSYDEFIEKFIALTIITFTLIALIVSMVILI
jgi:hypothetical protein